MNEMCTFFSQPLSSKYIAEFFVGAEESLVVVENFSVPRDEFVRRYF